MQDPLLICLEPLDLMYNKQARVRASCCWKFSSTRLLWCSPGGENTLLSPEEGQDGPAHGHRKKRVFQ